MESTLSLFVWALLFTVSVYHKYVGCHVIWVNETFCHQDDQHESSYFSTGAVDRTAIVIQQLTVLKDTVCAVHCMQKENCQYFQVSVVHDNELLCSLFEYDTTSSQRVTLKAGQYTQVDGRTNWIEEINIGCPYYTVCSPDPDCYGDTCLPYRGNYSCNCINETKYGPQCAEEYTLNPVLQDELFEDMIYGGSHLTVKKNEHFLMLWSRGSYDGSTHRSGYSWVLKYNEQDDKYKWFQYTMKKDVFFGSAIGGEDDYLFSMNHYYDRTRNGWGFDTYNPVYRYTDEKDIPKYDKNWALGKPTKQSSDNYNDRGFASNAVDGDKSTEWNRMSCTHTTNMANAWWMVDLEEYVQVLSVVITNRLEEGARLSNFVVGVGGKSNSFSSFSTGDFSRCDQYYDTVGGGATVHITCHPIRVGRFVYVRLQGTNFLTLCEVEVYGTSMANLTLTEGELGLRSRKLQDSSLSSSSDHNDCRTPYAYLDSGTAWCAASNNDVDAWIQVDLGIEKLVHKVVTQGRANYDQWVRKFELYYSKEGSDWYCYSDGPMPRPPKCRLFEGNRDRHTKKYNALRHYIRARYIRFVVKEYYNHKSMRIDVWGLDEFNHLENIRLQPSVGARGADSLKTKKGEILLAINQLRTSNGNADLYKSNVFLFKWMKDLKTFINIAMMPNVYSHDTWMGEIDGDLWVNTGAYSKTCCHNHGNAENMNHRVDPSLLDLSTVTTLGPQIKPYKEVDLATNYAIVIRDFEFPDDGEVLGWEVFSTLDPALEQEITFNVYRPVDDAACIYKVVGRTFYEYIETGYRRIPVMLRERIQVKKGDRIGLYWSGVATVPYVNEGTNDVCAKSGGANVGSTYTFSANWNKRTYHFRAIWRPFLKYNDEYITPVKTMEHETMYISCPRETWIEIKDAFYGEESQQCSSSLALTVVKESCEGVQSCSLVANNDGFRGDPCSGANKYAKVTYRCVNRPHALGLEMDHMEESQITVSQEYPLSTDCRKSNARINAPYAWGWCANVNEAGQWLKVDLQAEYEVTAIATQGRPGSDEYTKTYQLEYSTDDSSFTCYPTSGNCQTFTGNSDSKTIQTNTLDSPVTARYIKFVVQSWNRRVVLRVEVYSHGVPLGFENGSIPSVAFTSSSTKDWGAQLHSTCGKPQKGRLNKGSTIAWCGHKYKTGIDEWLQIDLLSEKVVTKVATQGRRDTSNFVKKYMLYYGPSADKLTCYKSADEDIRNNCTILDGNVNDNSIVTNILNLPIVARVVRFVVVEHEVHVAMRVEVYGYDFDASTNIALNKQATQSSDHSNNFPASNAVDGDGTTMSHTGTSSSSWIRVDLETDIFVVRVRVKNRNIISNPCESCWERINPFEIRIGNSLDITTNALCQQRTFNMSGPDDPVVTADCAEYGRYVGIYLASNYLHISELEVYTVTGAEAALGMESGAIQDKQITSSYNWPSDASCTARYIRLHWSKSFCCQWNYGGVDSCWVQFDHLEDFVFTGVATQGRKVSSQWVKSYEIYYSSNGKNFECYQKRTKDGCKVFIGNTDQSSVVTNHIQEPFVARYVKIVPLEYYSRKSFSVELYGYRASMERGLGMESFAIPKSAITASDEYPSQSVYLEPGIRLNTAASWCAAEPLNSNKWVAVDLGSTHIVTQIGIQGRHDCDCNQWVTSYTVSFSDDGSNFECFKEDSSENCTVFSGNTNKYAVVKNPLSRSVITKHVRVEPQTWHDHICMKIEIYGYTPGSVPSRGSTSVGMASRRLPDSQLSAKNQNSCCNTKYGRLLGSNAWASSGTSSSYYFEIDIGRVELVSAIASQGRATHTQWLTKYKVYYTDEKLYWDCFVEHSGCKTFTANTDKGSVVTNYFPYTVQARHLRIYTHAWSGYASARFEVYSQWAGFETIPHQDLNGCQSLGVAYAEYKGDFFYACPHHRSSPYFVNFFKWNRTTEMWDFLQKINDGWYHRFYPKFGVVGGTLIYSQPIHQASTSVFYKWDGSQFSKMSITIQADEAFSHTWFRRQNDVFLFQNSYKNAASGSNRYKQNSYVYKWT